MSNNKELFFENMFYQYLDELKFLFFPEKWETNLLDYSKNELLAITFIYRNVEVNMSEIAEYINAPLNTVSGVINRLEKKNVVRRKRDSKDKRVVNICLTEEGFKLFESEKKEIIYYVERIYNSLTEDEKIAIMGICGKVITILKEDKTTINKEEKSVKRVKKIIIE